MNLRLLAKNNVGHGMRIPSDCTEHMTQEIKPRSVCASFISSIQPQLIALNSNVFII